MSGTCWIAATECAAATLTGLKPDSVRQTPIEISYTSAVGVYDKLRPRAGRASSLTHIPQVIGDGDTQGLDVSYVTTSILRRKLAHLDQSMGHGSFMQVKALRDAKFIGRAHGACLLAVDRRGSGHCPSSPRDVA